MISTTDLTNAELLKNKTSPVLGATTPVGTTTASVDPYAADSAARADDRAKQDALIEQQRIAAEEAAKAIEAQTIAEQERQKKLADEALTKEGTAANIDYTKANNAYGVDAEGRATSGMGGTGFAESSLTRNFNTYQNRVTTAINTTRQIKADFDAKIQEAKVNGNVELARIAIDTYKQQMDLIQSDIDYNTQQTERRLQQENYNKTFDYNAAQDKQAQENYLKDFGYRSEQDKIAQQNYDKTFNYNVAQSAQDQKNWEKEYDRAVKENDQAYQQWLDEFKYTKKRDKVADKQWKAEYNLSKSKSGGSSGGGSNLGGNPTSKETPQDVINRITNIKNADGSYHKWTASEMLADLDANSNLTPAQRTAIYNDMNKKGRIVDKR